MAPGLSPANPGRGLGEPAWLWAGLVAVVVVANITVVALTSFVAGEMAAALPDVISASASAIMALTVALPLGGIGADRFGPRRMLLASLALLGLGALVCCEAQTIVVFGAGRALQGVAAGLCLPACLASVRPRRLGLSIGICKATLPVVVAGATTAWLLVADAATWRSAFVAMLGLDVAAFLLALFYRPVPREQAAARITAIFGDHPVRRPTARVRSSWTPATAAAVHLLLLTMAAAQCTLLFALSRSVPASEQAALGPPMLLLTLVSAPLVGLLADRVEPLWIALVGSIMLALCCGLTLARVEGEAVYLLQHVLTVLGYASAIALARRLVVLSGARLGLGVSLALLGFVVPAALAQLAATVAARRLAGRGVEAIAANALLIPVIGLSLSALSGLWAAIILARMRRDRAPGQRTSPSSL